MRGRVSFIQPAAAGVASLAPSLYKHGLATSVQTKVAPGAATLSRNRPWSPSPVEPFSAPSLFRLPILQCIPLEALPFVLGAQRLFMLLSR